MHKFMPPCIVVSVLLFLSVFPDMRVGISTISSIEYSSGVAPDEIAVFVIFPFREGDTVESFVICL